MSVELAVLVAQPVRVEEVGVEDLPRLIGEAEALRARLWARLQTASATHPAPAGPPRAQPDRLLTADEAAERLGVNRRWVYRHADSLPFTRRLSEGTVRFSLRGLERWEARR